MTRDQDRAIVRAGLDGDDALGPAPARSDRLEWRPKSAPRVQGAAVRRRRAPARRTRHDPASSGAYPRCRESVRRRRPASAKPAARCAGRCRSRSSCCPRRGCRRIAVRPARCNGAPAGRTSASRGSSRGSVAGDRQTLGDVGGQILCAVDGQVDLAVKQAVFEILDEEPFSASLAERRVLQPVARLS